MKRALAAIALALLVFAAYAPARDGVYLWDDHTLVERDAEMRTATLASLFTRPLFARDPMSDARPAYYRPLVAVSFRLDEVLLGPGPRGHHLTNVVLHVLAALLALACGTRLGAPPAAAWLGACAWALFPRSTEAVAWISGRTDVLASVFVLGATAAWPWRSRGDVVTPPPIASAVMLLAGLLSKEVAAAGVVALAGATWLSSRGAPRRQRLAWLAVPLAIYIPLRAWVLAGAPSAATSLDVGARALTALEATGRYAAMTLDPWHPQTSIGLVGAPSWGFASAGVLVLVAAGALVVRARAPIRQSPALVFALLGAASIAPVLHLLPVGLASAVTSDRLLYLPTAGLALCLAVLACRLPARMKTPLAVAALALCASFVPVTRARARDYTDELTFWLSAAEGAHPRNTAPVASLAGQVRDLGDAPLACRLYTTVERVLAQTGRAGTQRHTRAVENLASCLALAGDPDGARTLYAALIRGGHAAGRVHMGLGYAELHRFAFDEAEASLRTALALEPRLEPAAQALAELPRLRREAARLATEDARLREPIAWARLLAVSGRLPEAAARWEALASDPHPPRELLVEALGVLVAARDAQRASDVASTLATRGGVPPEGAAALDALCRGRAQIDAQRARLEAITAR